MDPILVIVGAEVRRLRKARRLTQATLGQAVGINPNLLGRIERGEQNPTLLTLARIADGLDVTIGELVQSCPRPRLVSASRRS